MNERFKKLRESEECRNGILIAGIIIGILIGFRYILPIVIPFLFACIAAAILRPIVDWLVTYRKWSEKLASILVHILVCGLILVIGKFGVTTLYRQVEDFVLYLPFYREQFMKNLGSCCSYIDTGFHLEAGASLNYATNVLSGIFSDFQTTMLPRLTTNTAAVLKQAFSSLIFLFIMFYATLCILKNYPRLFQGGKMGNYVKRIWEGIIHLLLLYLRAEGAIAFVQTIICSIGLWFLGNSYFMLLAILIGLVDAFPVFGSGTVLIPWAIYRFLTGDVKMGIGLFILYLLCTLNRQLLEPRLLGQNLGMSTLLTLFLMYVGYRLFGIFGFILGPVGYLVGREIFRMLQELFLVPEKPENG